MLRYSKSKPPTARRESLSKASLDVPGQDDAERAVSQVINRSFPLLDAGLYSDVAQRMIEARSTDGLINAMPWQDFIVSLGATNKPLEDAVRAAQHMELGNIGAVQAGMRLDAVDAISRKYAHEQGSKLIVNITDSQRATIRQIAGKALNGEYTVDQAARRIREGIGLHPRWATAVENYRARLEANPRPTGTSAARHAQQIDRSVTRYRDRLIKVRSQNIARTEILTAENLGRYASWADSIGQGFNSPASRKEWSPGPGACDICQGLAGEIVPWDGVFSNGAIMPPAHPSCRCSANLLPPEYANDALNPRSINWTAPGGDRAPEVDLSQFSTGFDALTGTGAADETAADLADDGEEGAGDDGGTETDADTSTAMEDAENGGDADAFPDYTATAEAEGLPAEPTIADTLTLSSTAHLSDDELAGLLTEHADDPEAIDRVLEIMDQRDALTAAAEQADARYLAEQEAARAEANTFHAWTPDPDPVTAPTARAERKLTPDQVASEEYQNYVMTQYSKALDDTNGVLLNKAGRAAAKNNPDLEMNIFSGQIGVARKYASEELLQWWTENGRETLASFRYKLLGRPGDKWAADNVRKFGYERGQAFRDRSQF